ncbi:MAG: serine hydrolase [Lewinellaceae bacterium]|nr:serine hydrolase [Lewinellaceae bacterium]
MDCSPAQAQQTLDTLRHHNVVLVSLHHMSSKSAINFGLSPQILQFLQELNTRNTVVLTVFGNPYSLYHFDDIPVVLEAYTEDPAAQDLAAQALFGAIDIKGKLPITASSAARFKQGITVLYPQHRLGYELPEAVGMSSDSLALIDSLVDSLIADGAAPGCQVLVARAGKVVWYKAYGKFEYDSLQPVGLESMFDLASVTKVAATTLGVMRETDLGRLDIQLPMSNYLPELKATNKKDLLTVEMLIHQAGLQAWIPFYLETVDEKGKPLPKWYKTQPEPGFMTPVADHLFMADAYIDTIWSRIFSSELRADKKYKYSDIDLYLTARTLERISGEPLDFYALSHFYKPLGLSTMMFTPWRYGKTALCPPTEIDHYFRQQKLQGYVHDMGAAMLGGVSGHAGLFSDANDLAIVFQMLLNEGSYFGKTYLKPETVAKFTTHYPGSTRRGIGFDMKERDPKASLNMAAEASDRSFGHLGFTGNAVWADPDADLIFIFLSNRTMPTMKNNKLINGDYRPRIQRMVYQSIVKTHYADQ